MIINPLIDNDKNSREWRISLSSDATENTKILQSEFLKQNYSNTNLAVFIRALFEVQMPETNGNSYAYGTYAHNIPSQNRYTLKQVETFVQNSDGTAYPGGGVASNNWLNSENFMGTGGYLHLESDGSLWITGTEERCFSSGNYIVMAFIFEDTSSSNLLATSAPPMLMGALRGSTDDEEEEIIGEN